MLINFEGIDGCGKTTQLGLLLDRLLGNGYQTLALREPGGTDVSEAIRSLLLDDQYHINPVAELLLFSSARAQLTSERIRPALDAGTIVLLDRYYDSTSAYQGYGRQQLSLEAIDEVNKVATGGLVPDVTFYFDVDIDTAFSRRAAAQADRMEQSGRDFFQRVRDGYLELARKHADRFVKLDASLPMQHIHELVWTHVQVHLDQLKLQN
jgi:dTMP kinase